MQSWADKCRHQNTKKNAAKHTIQINVPSNISPQTNNVNKKIKQNKHNKHKQKLINKITEKKKQYKQKNEKVINHKPKEEKFNDNKIKIIPDDQFIFNHFVDTERTLLFQIVIIFLSETDALEFMHSVRKFAKLFHKKTDKSLCLLFIYKQLYHRDFGVIRFRHKRRSKLNRQQQFDKYKANITDYTYWKKQYEYQLEKENKFYIRFSDNKLSFYRLKSAMRMIYKTVSGDMIIVTKHKCKSEELLNIDNVIWSNWYDIDKNSLHKMKMIINNGMRGFKQILMDRMMRNIMISKHGWSRGYVFPARYIKKRCYLIEMVVVNEEERYCNEKVDCILVEIDGERNVLKGIVFDRIININELKDKMVKYMNRLEVVVYGMNAETKCDAEMFEMNLMNGNADVVYVVVDYYD